MIFRVQIQFIYANILLSSWSNILFRRNHLSVDAFDLLQHFQIGLSRELQIRTFFCICNLLT